MVFRKRFGRGNSMRPVNRIKHVVDQQSAFGFGTNNNINLIESKDAPVIANTTQVQTGSTVNGIYLKVECYSRTSGALANAYMIIVKNPGNQITLPNANVVGSSDVKKYVIHQEMIMLERAINGNPRILFNGVIAIPKGYRRFGPNDKLIARFANPGVDIELCLQCHYKEFR